MTKKILDIILSLFLLICAIVMIFFVINGKNILKHYSTALEAQENTAIELKNTLQNISLKYFAVMENQVKVQKNFYATSKIFNTIIFETGIAISAGALEKEGELSFADANEIIDQSIDKITTHSERLGVLAKALNDVLRNQYFEKKTSKSKELKPVPNQKSVNGRFVTNSTAGTLFVITGRVENPSNISYGYIQVKGALITKGKTEAKTKVVYCGNIISEEMLKRGNISDINKLLMIEEGSHNTNISLSRGASVPFMVVFADLPEKLQNFTVKVTKFKN
jgi:hypothetical protein